MAKTSMVKYDQKREPIGVAYGNYHPSDVEDLIRDGYVEVDEDIARELDRKGKLLTKMLNNTFRLTSKTRHS